MTDSTDRLLPKRKKRPRRQVVPGMTHADACLIHARRRSKQRLGISMSKVKLASMVKAIQGGRARSVGKSSNYRTKFLFKSRGKFYVALYSKRMKTIITVWNLGNSGPLNLNRAVAI